MREIGRGGMGVVYEAEQMSLGRRVAVKVLPCQYLPDSKSAQRFAREAQTAAKLHHTNIVPVFGVGQDAGYHYYVMQRIEGVGLDAVLARLPGPGQDAAATALAEVETPGAGRTVERLEELVRAVIAQRDGTDASLAPPRLALRTDTEYWRSVARIGVQVAEALQYAHAQGTLHRDIKPANLLLDAQGVVCVADFGLAKAVEEEGLSQTGDVVGTLRNPQIPRDLETIVSKATAREPTQRYPAAAELAHDLRCFLEDRPIHARRSTPLEQLWRWCRRNRAIAGLAASALALLVLVAVVSSIAYVRTRNANIQVTAALTKAETISGLSLQALDEIFERFAPDRSVALPELTMARTAGEDIRMPVQPVLSKETAALLEHMIGFYGRLAQPGAGDIELRQKVANANRRVGDIRQRLGQFEQAEEAYVQALELYQELAQERPGDTVAVRELARIHNEIGNVQWAGGRPAAAQASYGKALAVLASMPVEPSTPAPYRFEWARTHYLLGKRPGRESGPGPPEPKAEPARPDGDRKGPPAPPPGEKEDRQAPDSGPPKPAPDRQSRDAHLGKAIAILEPHVDQQPAIPDYRLMLARCYRELAPLEPGRAQGPAPDPLDKATAVLQKLAEDYPDVPDYRYELCETLAAPRIQGPRFVAEEDPAAERRLRRALEIAQGLGKEHPNIPEYAAAEIHIHHKLAHVLQGTDRPREAEASLRTALDLQSALVRQFPAVKSHRAWRSVIQDSLANLLAERDELNEARSLLEDAVATLHECQAGEAKPTYQHLLSRDYEALADVLSRLGEREQAEAARRQAQDPVYGKGHPIPPKPSNKPGPGS